MKARLLFCGFRTGGLARVACEFLRFGLTRDRRKSNGGLMMYGTQGVEQWWRPEVVK
jgi:hypothetical protein